MTDTVDLKAHREAAAERLASAKQAAAAALLDGAQPDLAALPLAEASLAAIDAAEIERARRDREAQAARYDVAVERYRTGLTVALKDRMAAIGRAEAAARDMAQALADESEASTAVNSAMLKLGKHAPMSLSPNAVETRMSARLIALLRRVMSVRRRYGSLVLGPAIEVDHTVSWVQDEAKVVHQAIESILKGKRNG